MGRGDHRIYISSSKQDYAIIELANKILIFVLLCFSHAMANN